MRYDSDDALDRALFALPLEEPPAELRASILAATAYRPAPAFSVWEISGLAALCGIVAWLAWLVAMGGGTLFMHTLGAMGGATVRTLSNTSVLAWIAAGGVTALWLSLFTGSQPFALAGQRSGERSGR